MKRYSRVVIMLVLGVLTLALLLRVGNIELSMATLRQIDPRYFVVAVVIHYSGFAMRGWRWQKLLAGLGHRLSYVYTTALLLTGWFVSALLPARLGDVARALMLRRDHNIAVADGVSTIATERALDIAAILGLAGLASVWALAGRTPPWVWQTIAAGITFFAILVIGLFIAPQLETKIVRLFPWRWYQMVAKFGFDTLAGIRQLGQNPTLLGLVLGQSIYIWSCDVLLLHFIFISIGLTPALSVSAFTAMAVDLAAAVPVIPGAVGQFEAAAIGLLTLFNIPAAQSSLMVLLNRLISFWSFILFSGLVTYVFGFSEALKSESLNPEPVA